MVGDFDFLGENIIDRRHQSFALLAIQIYSYHIRRERSARAHKKGVFGLFKLLKWNHGILAHIRTELLLLHSLGILIV